MQPEILMKITGRPPKQITIKDEMAQDRATALRLLNPMVYEHKLDKLVYQASLLLRRNRSKPLPNITRFNAWVNARGRSLSAQGLVRPLDLTGANLKHAELSGVNLSATNLSDADFSRAWVVDADLHGAAFNGATFQFTVMTGARMHDGWSVGADFSGANLTKVNMRRTDLSHAVLDGVVATDANFVGAKMDGMDLSIAGLHDAIFQERETFSGRLRIRGRDLFPRQQVA